MYSVGEKKPEVPRPGRGPASLLTMPGAKRGTAQVVGSGIDVPVLSLLRPIVSKDQQKRLNRKARKEAAEAKDEEEEQIMKDYIFQFCLH